MDQTQRMLYVAEHAGSATTQFNTELSLVFLAALIALILICSSVKIIEFILTLLYNKFSRHK